MKCFLFVFFFFYSWYDVLFVKCFVTQTFMLHKHSKNFLRYFLKLFGDHQDVVNLRQAFVLFLVSSYFHLRAFP